MPNARKLLNRSQIVVLVRSFERPPLEDTMPILRVCDALDSSRVGTVLPDRGSTAQLCAETKTARLCWTGTYWPVRIMIREETPDSMSVFGVIARWVVRKEASCLFEEALRQNAETSILAETGCVAFGYARLCGCSRGANLQQYFDASEYALVECFEHESDFHMHLRSTHFVKFREAVNPFFLGDRTVTTKGYGCVRPDELRSFGNESH